MGYSASKCSLGSFHSVLVPTYPTTHGNASRPELYKENKGERNDGHSDDVRISGANYGKKITMRQRTKC